MSSPNKQQQRTVKPVTQIATQLRASFTSRCAGRYITWGNKHGTGTSKTVFDDFDRAGIGFCQLVTGNICIHHDSV